jgi:exonuclease III
VLPVTEALYAQRSARIGRFLREQVQADVIAFQEVSGAAAVRELLGDGWKVCSYEGHKVQRTAIAWKASLGDGSCRVNWPLALPERPMKDQVRPGLALTLTHEGKRLSVLTVHLKSSCVSPLDDQSRTPGRGQLDSSEPNCQSLQAQVAPLEAWLDAELKASDALVALGDFNRNLAHEATEDTARGIRTDGRTRNLWRELNDGDPKPLTLLGAECAPTADGRALCSLAKGRLLSGPEYGALRGQLGCRNPIGLDHIVLGGALQADGAQKLALAAEAETRADQLGLSDHCPVRAVLRGP